MNSTKLSNASRTHDVARKGAFNQSEASGQPNNVQANVAGKFCKCWSKDPKCKRCGKPQRLCENWHQKMDMTYERRKHVTKKQEAAFKKLVEVFSSKPIHELIDIKKFRAHFGKVARAELRANKIPTKGLTGEDCIALSIQHSRAFLGMDRPNVFTGVDVRRGKK